MRAWRTSAVLPNDAWEASGAPRRAVERRLLRNGARAGRAAADRCRRRVVGLGLGARDGVGVATWVAHLYAEIVGDHVRRGSAVDRTEVTRAMVDGLPIPLAAVVPGVMLGLGRVDVLDERVALWAAVVVAVGQLVGVGAFVGGSVSRRGASVWSYAGATAAIGLAVVSLKLALGH